MEYIIKDSVKEYLEQRKLLIEKQIGLDQNSANYNFKNTDLQIQIDKIDFKIGDLFFMIKDFKIQELNSKQLNK